MKKLLVGLFIMAWQWPLQATHNRAGEITYVHKNGSTYEVIITTYTRDSAPADRCTLEINWGDNSTSTLPRTNGPAGDCQSLGGRQGELIGNDVRKNEYKGTHTYRGTGSFKVWFEDPNRNAGVSNIPNSVNVPFYVETEIFVDNSLGGNNSVILDNPPIDDGCVNQRYEHSPGAHDPDGDSLSFRLVPCRSAQGVFINSTYDPNLVQDSVKIDPRTGLLSWDVPRNAGQYNFAFEISEWRRNSQGQMVKVGYVVRDMQINIEQCPQRNNPPKLPEIGPFCVEAGELLTFNFSATDPDDDPISLRAFGGPYLVPVSPAFPLTSSGSNPVNGVFRWQTVCEHIRRQPYLLTLEAKDDPSGRSTNLPRLVDFSIVEITVVAPAPQNPNATANENDISLAWDPSPCAGATGYKIYRREEAYGFVPSQCETGVPGYTGYELIDSVDGAANTNYLDDFDLKRGVKYCYMVVACFPGEVESYASEEFCTSLPLTKPMMTHVDVMSTGEQDGEVWISWIYPPELDSTLFPPPYSFRLLRAEGINGNDFTEVTTTTDTFFTDQSLNTRDGGWRYQVEMYFGASNTLLGNADPASSVFLNTFPSDRQILLRFENNTPWRNDEYYVFKEDNITGNFEVLDTAFTNRYTDTGLVNGETYCYRVQTSGAYTASANLPAPLLNRSQERCASPIDTVPPCPPVLSHDYYCERDSLYLSWEYPDDSSCIDDVIEYRIYHKAEEQDDFGAHFATVSVPGEMSISITDPPLLGCYAVRAVDNAGNDPGGVANISDFSKVFCASACPNISFPNVFTPNGDGSNDFFTAIDYRNIGELEIKIFNRWGTLVYQSPSAQDFLQTGWDGRDQKTGRPVSNGVYFFQCQYVPESLDEGERREVTGFLHLFTDR